MPKGKPNKRYTPEFKIKVVETMHREKLSYRETARQFDNLYRRRSGGTLRRTQRKEIHRATSEN